MLKKILGEFELRSVATVDGIFCTLPIRTVSEANSREHWHVKARRHTLHKDLVYLALNKHKDIIRLPCILKVTRYAPGTLDKHDNLPISLKWIVDACCEIITDDKRVGRADSDER